MTQQDIAHKKLMKLIDSALYGDHSSSAFNDFIKNTVRESKCRNRVKDLQNYIKRCIKQECDSSYSILKPSEVKSIAEEILWIYKKPRKLSF